MTTYVGATAVEIAAAVREGRWSPTAVLQEHLDHIDRVDPRIGAFQSRRDEAARKEAAALRERDDLADLPLAGVPIAVKDVVDVIGEVTTHGSTARPLVPATSDDPTVARLRAAGAIIVGKTRGPELSVWGASDNRTGAAVNPWDPTLTSGGSSGGSAAAVAAALVPLALGSDGLGSIRIPCASCGCVGIKPGSGVVPMQVGDRDEHWFGMTQYGPIATTVADAALGLAVLSGDDRLAAVSPPDRPLSVAISTANPTPGMPVAAAYREAAIEAGRVLRTAGNQVARVRVGNTPAETLAIFRRWTVGTAQDADELSVDLAAAEPRTRAHARIGRALAPWLTPTPREVERWRERLAPLFAVHDVLITPVFAQDPLPARDWHNRPWAANLVANLRAYPFPSLWNLADVPAMSVPIGRGPTRRPLSVQLIAPHGRERLLLEVAAQLERERPWDRHAPVAQLG